MIFPSKYIHESSSLLGASAELLKNMDTPKTVTELWFISRGNDSIVNYQRFVLALDLLYMMGVISFSDGLITKEKS